MFLYIHLQFFYIKPTLQIAQAFHGIEYKRDAHWDLLENCIFYRHSKISVCFSSTTLPKLLKKKLMCRQKSDTPSKQRANYISSY